MNFIFITLTLLSALAQDLPPGHPPISNSTPPPEQTRTLKPVDSEQAVAELKVIAAQIDSKSLQSLPMQHNGRIKPLHTLARESLLFIGGRHQLFNTEPVSLMLALPLSETAPFVNWIDIRDPKLREDLGFLKTQKHFSIADLEKSPLMQIAQPILEKEQRNSRAVSPSEKNVIEVYNQLALARMMIDGSLFLQSIDFKPLVDRQPSDGDSEIIRAGQAFLKGLAEGRPAQELAGPIQSAVASQTLPDMLKPQLRHMSLEVQFNKIRIFFWTGVLLFIIGCLLSVPNLVRFASDRVVLALLFVPVVTISVGLWMRVIITGFAPVTNMYGTMIWVALGVVLFSGILFGLYRNRALTGMLSVASGLLLLLTESIPLILSPDLDPIVAVLRSNYWLTIHVLTITISYAAFTITMVIGNVALVRSIFLPKSANQVFFKTYAHYAYRMIQLGVFLLTAGIILGGIWADYSWGRFWGWDPKETWALIADVGFIAILHARYTGWLKDFGTLAAAPVAYLLVIMAWYGVNFILAAGLHSYGFSSGGAWAVGVFVAAQIGLLIVAMARAFDVFGAKRQNTEPK